MPRHARLARRLLQLYSGLVLYGVSSALIILSALGNDPWDVLHQGLSRQTGIGTGAWVCIVGALVLLLWIPLRQRPGLGTLSNVVVIGLVMEVVLTSFEAAEGAGARAVLLLAGVVLNGIATGLYIGASLGPGPRDGLMTGLAARGHSLRAVRTGIELTVLAAGAALGGTVGIGTLVYALSIGPLAHVFVPAFTVPPGDREPVVAPRRAARADAR
ncbi:MAG: YczE/YyaS/YitT family protein [Solirubrobacteraceae bacterium]